MNPLTYEKCKELWARVKDPEKGRSLPEGGYARLFKNKNNSFTVFEMPGRGRYQRLNEPRKLFTITPRNQYIIHATPSYHSDPAQKRMVKFLPLKQTDRWSYLLRVPAPTARKEPAKPTVAKVHSPRYVGPGEYGREEYEAGLKEYGTLDKWFAAWKKYDKAVRAYTTKVAEWRDSQMITIAEGLVLNADGTVTPNSVLTMEAKKRAEQRRRDAERERQNREWKKQREQQQRLWAAEERKRKAEQKKALANLKKLHPELKSIKDGAAAKFLLDQKVKIKGTTAVMFKAVKENGESFNVGSQGHITYKVGETVECPDWTDYANCAGGLFFWTTPSAAVRWRNGVGKTIQCEVDLKSMILVDGNKVKVKSCKVIKEV